jgi:hypothetical protein
MDGFKDLVEDSLDVVVYHTLAAGNMMEAERLRGAALHVVRASHAALSIGLNDVNRWKQGPDEMVSRPCLWWVLYFLEKRIHYKCGIPYLLRPSEVNMIEFLTNKGDPEIEDVNLDIVESMISWCKLWALIWQDFLAPNPPLAGKWAEVQIADSRIVVSYKELPPRLLWNTAKVGEYIDSGLTVIDMRRTLQVYLVSQ